MGVGPTGKHYPEDGVPTLPYDDLSDLFKKAIEDALREAWRRLPEGAEQQSVDLRTAHETPVTRLLRDELEKLRRDESRPIPDFNEDAFSHIPESECVPDASAQPFDHTTNEPDLVVRPAKTPANVARTSMYGLYIECKIIEAKRSCHHEIVDYCKSGLQRFLDGRYASVMPSGMMVAYVRDGRTVSSCLIPYLRDQANTYEVRLLPEARQNDERTPPVYVSRHGRANVLVGAKRRPVGDIDIAHLWLHVAQ
jgi:hypothetical protein